MNITSAKIQKPQKPNQQAHYGGLHALHNGNSPRSERPARLGLRDGTALSQSQPQFQRRGKRLLLLLLLRVLAFERRPCAAGARESRPDDTRLKCLPLEIQSSGE